MNRLVAVAVVVPLVALPAAALVLRHFAPGPVHGARVEAAPPAANGALAWQLVTEVEDRGVREAVPLSGLVATLRGPFGERVWRGESNADGIAELHFDAVVAPGVVAVPPPAELALEVRAGNEVLVSGPVTWDAATTPAARPAFLPASLHEGELSIDVAVAGARLVAGFAVPLWVRVRSAASGDPVSGADLSFTPEPGLELARETTKTCAAGWAEVDATAIVHVAELGIEAHGDGGRSGRWHGSVPVAPGATYVALPRNVEANRPLDLQLQLVGARDVEYVEVDDARGRVLGVAVPLSLGSEGRRHGAFTLPPLDPAQLANAWLVTRSEPTFTGDRGTPADGDAEGDTRLAHPLRPRSSSDACADAGAAASLVAGRFPRWVALDGFASRDRSPELRRARLARGLALGILALAALVETLVIVAAARKNRAPAAEDEEDVIATRAVAAPRMIAVVTMIAVAWLGFGLFAMLILTRTGR